MAGDLSCREINEPRTTSDWLPSAPVQDRTRFIRIWNKSRETDFQYKKYHVRFEVLTTNMNTTAFCVKPSILVELDRRFRGAYCHHQFNNRLDYGSSTHLWSASLLQRDYTALSHKAVVFKAYKKSAPFDIGYNSFMFFHSGKLSQSL
jgi:hypothetical protein